MSSLPIKEKIVEELAQLPEESVREVYQLVQKLKLQLAGQSASREPAQSGASSHNGQAWKEFFEIGDALMASDAPELETLTTSVLKMRR